jgi:hypothetical protein
MRDIFQYYLDVGKLRAIRDENEMKKLEEFEASELQLIMLKDKLFVDFCKHKR